MMEWRDAEVVPLLLSGEEWSWLAILTRKSWSQFWEPDLTATRDAWDHSIYHWQLFPWGGKLKLCIWTQNNWQCMTTICQPFTCTNSLSDSEEKFYDLWNKRQLQYFGWYLELTSFTSRDMYLLNAIKQTDYLELDFCCCSSSWCSTMPCSSGGTKTSLLTLLTQLFFALLDLFWLISAKTWNKNIVFSHMFIPDFLKSKYKYLHSALKLFQESTIVELCTEVDPESSEE